VKRILLQLHCIGELAFVKCHVLIGGAARYKAVCP
jgi:hypothetical protein